MLEESWNHHNPSAITTLEKYSELKTPKQRYPRLLQYISTAQYLTIDQKMKT
jgi:hypothetical protein